MLGSEGEMIVRSIWALIDTYVLLSLFHFLIDVSLEYRAATAVDYNASITVDVGERERTSLSLSLSCSLIEHLG